MRNPHGSAEWDGMGWKVSLGARPPFCGAIPLQGCVWGASCCYRTVAVEGRSFLSEEMGFEPVSEAEFLVWVQLELRWTPPPWGCTWCLCQGEQAGPAGPKIITTPKKSLHSNSHTLESTQEPLTSTQNNCNIHSYLTSILPCLGFARACSI